MTKLAIDNDGNVVEVSDDTPTKVKDGINYLLTSEEQAEYDATLQASILPTAQDSKIVELKAFLDTDGARNVTHEGNTVRTSEYSVNGSSAKRNSSIDIIWYYDNDTSAVLTPTQVADLNNIVIARDQYLRDYYNQQKAAIMALSDVNSVESFDVTAAWGP